jgi:preprotein translocase subunit SecF
MTAVTAPPAKKRSIWTRLYHGETEIDFVGRWKLWFGISGVLIIIGLGALGIRGLNLGIDFTGGNVWQIPRNGHSVSDVEDALHSLGITDTKVQTVGGDLRVQTPAFKGTEAQKNQREQQVVSKLSQLSGTTERAVEQDQNTVGPTWGAEISSKAIRALVIFFVAISIYITLRFELKMAVATLAALVHDLLIVVGAYAILQLPVTPATVIAILTILGFSIYDGIVVFDRVDENTRLLSAGARLTYTEMTDLSLNQVLMRSLNTQITALLPIISVLIVGSVILGATTLQEFGLALFLGQLSGAYSSIFIASPVLALLKEREPRYQALRKRLEERSSRDRSRGDLEAELAHAEVAPDTSDGEEATTAAPAKRQPAKAAAGSSKAPAGRPGTYSANHPPRPRKKGKRR